MSSTQNLTVLFGVQVLQTTVYYAYIGIVFNNFGTVAKTIFYLFHDPVYICTDCLICYQICIEKALSGERSIVHVFYLLDYLV